jgi:hypothetical protein
MIQQARQARGRAESTGTSYHSIGLDLSADGRALKMIEASTGEGETKQSSAEVTPLVLQQPGGGGATKQVSPRALELPPLERSVSTPRDHLDECLPTPRSGIINVESRTDLQTGGAIIPAWEPAASFSFPIFQIPIKHPIPNDLTMEHFYEIKHIADGSNSNIFLARFRGERVIIKMIKQSAEMDSIAIQEVLTALRLSFCVCVGGGGWVFVGLFVGLFVLVL